MLITRCLYVEIKGSQYMNNDHCTKIYRYHFCNVIKLYLCDLVHLAGDFLNNIDKA